MINRKVICIGGYSGSGKSTVTEKLVAQYGEDNCIVIPIDNYYKKEIGDFPDISERAKTNFDSPDSIDFDLLLKHIQDLKNGLVIDMPQWDFETHRRKPECIEVNPQGKEFIFPEGIFALEVVMAKISDMNVFVDTYPAIALLRRLKRDSKERGRSYESIITQCETTVIPMQIKNIEPFRNREDLIIIKNDVDDLTGIDITPVVQRVNALRPVVPTPKDVLDDLSDFLDQDQFAVVGAGFGRSFLSLFNSASSYASAGMEYLDKQADRYFADEMAEESPRPS